MKVRTFEQAAIESAAAITPEDIELLRFNISYTNHHFGYGLYLRNKYYYLVNLEWSGDNRYSYIEKDDIGVRIYHHISQSKKSKRSSYA